MVFDVYSINSANVKFTRRVRDEPANRLNRGHNGVKKSTLVKNKCEISLKCMFFLFIAGRVYKQIFGRLMRNGVGGRC